MTTEQDTPIDLATVHRWCFLCGQSNPWSLRLSFIDDEDGSVVGRFRSQARLQGYDCLLHGGVIAALLDAAMTHCLFHRAVRAVTADLQVRFKHSIPADAELELRARVLTASSRLYRLRAEVILDGSLMAWGEGTFMPQPMDGVRTEDDRTVKQVTD